LTVAEIVINKALDVRGLNCPLPLLRTKKALADMASAQVLQVLATDPGSVLDLKVFAMQTGHEMLSTEQRGKEYVFLIKKK